MKQNFFAVDLGATSGRTILGTFIEGGLNLEEINRFPNHLIEVGGHFYWSPLPTSHCMVAEVGFLSETTPESSTDTEFAYWIVNVSKTSLPDIL